MLVWGKLPGSPNFKEGETMRSDRRGDEQVPTAGTLEEKLDFLARLGFRLAEPFGSDELLQSWPRSNFEKPGFASVLFGLAMTEERPPWRPHSVNMCNIDRESVVNQGDYIRIAEEMN
jgi:hypothetical protein